MILKECRRYVCDFVSPSELKTQKQNGPVMVQATTSFYRIENGGQSERDSILRELPWPCGAGPGPEAHSRLSPVPFLFVICLELFKNVVRRKTISCP